MPAPAGQSCANCEFKVQRGADPNFWQECHFDPSIITPQTNTWRRVEQTDWCGQWKKDGAKIADQYLHGALSLQTTAVMTLLTLPAGQNLDNVVMRGCQLLNTSTNDTVVVSFLDGPVAANVIGFVSCGPKQSKEIEFVPGLMSSQGNNICVKLDQSVSPGYMYVTAQGFVIGQQSSAVIEVSET